MTVIRFLAVVSFLKINGGQWHFFLLLSLWLLLFLRKHLSGVIATSPKLVVVVFEMTWKSKCVVLAREIRK